MSIRTPQRCGSHGLATAPDGLCVVCRRELQVAESPRLREPSLAPSHSNRPGIGFAVLLALGFATEYGIRRSTPHAAGAQVHGVHQAAAVNISMYSTSWCGACAKARSYMHEHDIPFTDYNVERDRAAAQRMHELNPRGSVPTIAVEDYVMIGFNPYELQKQVELASKRGS
jgi:glutaredoxin